MYRVSQNQCKALKKLHLSKYRYSERQFLIEGDKIVKEAIQEQRNQIKAIYVVEDYTPSYDLPKEVPIYILTEIQSKTLTQLSTPANIMALMNMPDIQPYDPSQNAIFLESIRDPGNLGTIMRICDWYAVPQILLTPDCVDVYNAKVIQSSMGSFMRIKCIPVEKIPDLTPYRYIADLEGIPIEHVSFQEPFVLQLGNESKGIQNKVKDGINITIPRIGKAESLNVAIATAICLDRMRTSIK